MVENMIDRITKERLNIILLIDTSKSMQGRRIQQVEYAIRDIQDYLKELQKENANVDFYLTLISFSTGISLYNNQDYINVIVKTDLNTIHSI